MIRRYSLQTTDYSPTRLPENRRLLVLMERENLGGVSAAGKLTGESEDDVVADGSHWARTLRALAALVSCTAESRARPRLNDPNQPTASIIHLQ